MRRIYLASGEKLKASDLQRTGSLPQEIVEAAQLIIDDVRVRGDEALREYELRFDGVALKDFRIAQESLEAALTEISLELREALEHAAQQIKEFHLHEYEESWEYTRPNGTSLGIKITPVSSAALYVPGGRAQYPSTVLMDAIPAKVAGVDRLIMLTPPNKEGRISAQTLAAAAVAGIDEVYAVGGAQAIAAAAYGTASIPQVDKIVGPGNAYVAAAKRLVSGDVGIDMIAGPSEVCVLADGESNPVVVAADLMAQAEHDPLATSYLVTCEAEFANQVEDALDRLLLQSPRQDITQASLDDQGLVLVCEDIDTALDAINAIAPEHLELNCANADMLIDKVVHAGAIFVGPWSSEPLGDYVAGPNHTLPTGGTARFSNPLGVYDFQKRSSIIRYKEEGLQADGPAVQTLAHAEGLWAHALSVGLRLKLVQEGSQSLQDLEKIAETSSQIAWP